MLLVYCLLLLVYFQFVLDREGAIQRFRRDNARAIYETGSRLLLFSNEIIAICAGTGDKEANGGESSVNPGGEEQPDGSVGVCLQVSFTAGHPGDLKPHQVHLGFCCWRSRRHCCLSNRPGMGR